MVFGEQYVRRYVKAWDPPVATAQAMVRSVRTMRLRAIERTHPGLVPENADTGDGSSDNGFVTVDFA